jgi:zinc transporter, ZIP family
MARVTAALGWGALAAGSLVLGALLGLAGRWPDRLVGLVLGFGAGALISAVAFELAAEGVDVGTPTAVAIGLALGALTYYTLDGLVARLGTGRSRQRRSTPSAAGPALALGAFLDGIPEQLVLGIGIAGGAGVSVGLLAAVFVSNLPEAIGSVTAMRAGGSAPSRIVALWVSVALVCTGATVAGYAIADSASGDVQAAIDGFAAGALLVMLVDSMIPEATSKAGRTTGLITALGFAVAAGLSALS